jgi:two-component system sensor histidine kinase PilS (NtrC family)
VELTEIRSQTQLQARENFPREQILIQSSRIGIYLVVLLLALLSQFFTENFINWSLLKDFYIFVAIGLLVHSLPLFFLTKYFSNRRWVLASFLGDVFLISMLAIRTQLHQSLFLFLYLLCILLSGLIFRSRGALLIALASSLGYSAVTLFGTEMKSLAFLFLIILNNLAFFVVAWLAGYLADQLDLLGSKLEAETLSLRSFRKLNELILETIPSGLITSNLAGEILTANLGAEVLLGSQELPGKIIEGLLPETLISGETKELNVHVQEQDLLLRVSCFEQKSSDLSEPIKLWILENLTEMRKLEFALRQSEKMAAIGQLASGIAHEIRNPLAGISGSIELLSLQNTTEDDKKLTKIILREIDRLNNLITEFLDYSKPEKPPTSPIDLPGVLAETINLAKGHQPALLVVQQELAVNIKILGDRDKLKQAFLNIIINAYQAMSQSQNPVLTLSAQSKDSQVVLRIKDSGAGMPEAVKKRIFEPFMTTKPKGTGLGLAVTHKILQSHRAQIYVESTQGLGTEFIITFPISNN